MSLGRKRRENQNKEGKKKKKKKKGSHGAEMRKDVDSQEMIRGCEAIAGSVLSGADRVIVLYHTDATRGRDYQTRSVQNNGPFIPVGIITKYPLERD